MLVGTANVVQRLLRAPSQITIVIEERKRLGDLSMPIVTESLHGAKKGYDPEAEVEHRVVLMVLQRLEVVRARQPKCPAREHLVPGYHQKERIVWVNLDQPVHIFDDIRAAERRCRVGPARCDHHEQIIDGLRRRQPRAKPTGCADRLAKTAKLNIDCY